MRLCLIGKYPPIQGGVSAQTYWLARELAAAGHQVHCVTNAAEVEPEFRMHLRSSDTAKLESHFRNGGSVVVHNTSQPPGLQHVPYANPYLTKLAALAADVVDGYGCELILAWYLEPYGLAGALAARWTGVPLAVRHAGSDIGRLAQRPDRARAYRELLRSADLVVTGTPVVRAMLAAGVSLDRLHLGGGASWPAEFCPGAVPADIPAVLDEVAGTAFASPLPAAGFQPGLPVIGAYGKIGRVKGTPQLIDALAGLDRSGRSFNLVLMCGVAGDGPSALAGYLRRAGLAGRAVMLPFLPPWRVPSVLRACTAVAVLEHRFPITIHQPSTPLEVLATGTCLVVSEEIRARQRRPAAFTDGDNAIIIADPGDQQRLSSALALVIDQPETAALIGRRGAQLFDEQVQRADVTGVTGLTGRLAELAERKDTVMSLRSFQAALARLYTSTTFRDQVRADPSALDEAELTVAERTALAGLASMRGELDGFAADLRHKAFDFAWKHFPTLDRYVPGAREVASEAFHRQFDFADRDWLGNIEYIATLITEAAERTGALPACVPDVIRYDLGVLRAATTPLPGDELGGLAGQPAQAATSPGSHPLAGTAPTGTDDAGPEEPLGLRPGTVIGEFEHDIPALLTGTPAANLPTRRVAVAFVPARDSAAAVAFGLAPGAELLVRLASQADGGMTPTELASQVAQMKAAVGEPGFLAACLRTVTLLREQGVLVLAGAAG
jgi:glycosyltransferase involved in cell wall biosynthesis